MFVNCLGDVAPHRFPIIELITAVITVYCTLMRRRRFHCPPSVPITMACDSRQMIAADRPSSNRLYPMPVVQRWFDGFGWNYGILHLIISAATELNLGIVSLLLGDNFK
jgi:hypothetical protein